MSCDLVWLRVALCKDSSVFSSKGAQQRMPITGALRERENSERVKQTDGKPGKDENSSDGRDRKRRPEYGAHMQETGQQADEAGKTADSINQQQTVKLTHY
jgi:hypothetical protein